MKITSRALHVRWVKRWNGYLATDHMKLNEDDATSKHKTVSGWVGYLVLLD